MEILLLISRGIQFFAHPTGKSLVKYCWVAFSSVLIRGAMMLCIQ